MGTLHAALAWAKRGFPVFPLRENTKEPTSDYWTDIATTDAEAIRRMWTDPVLGTELNYNIGCKCNDLVVIDVDTKSGKNGYAEYVQLGGHFETLVVRTTSGGFHCYFIGPESSNAPLTKNGVDVRSHNGYVVAPGSVVDGQRYEIVRDGEPVWVPMSIERMLKSPYEKKEYNDNLALDTPAAIEAAIGFLQSAPVAVEGQRGDETTFVTAARLVREMGLSVATAHQLLIEHWNERCQPPWDWSELLTKVENAAAYGSAEHGRISAEQLYGHLPPLPPPPSVFDQSEATAWGNAVIPQSIRPRPWLMERALMMQAVTVLMAAGSAGKSSISLALAAHLALGLDFAGYKTVRAMKSIIYNGEDDLEEQSRRLLAVCSAYNFDYEKVKSQVMLLSARELKMELATAEYSRVVRNEVLIQQIINKASDEDVGLLILDPLVKVHKCNESDNVQMDGVMEILTDIAHHANIAVLALHHTSKGGGSNEDRIGNADIGRGASAIINAARIGFTLLNAANQDSEDYGFPADERHLWARLDDAKMNLSLASSTATWFRREGVRIISGDIVGVLRHTKLEKSVEHIRGRIASLLISNMEMTGAGSMTLPQAIAAIKQNEPLWANKTDAEIKKRVEGMFMVGTIMHGKTLKATRDDAGKILLTLS